MNKTELTKRISERMSVPYAEVRDFIEAFEASVTDALKEDKNFMLQGFGVLSLWKQTARQGRNPRTGETCPIRPRISVKFKPGKKLLKELNGTLPDR
jgi:DNA-binding protein HU-beta